MCDNASNNDTMITELAHLLDEFPGAANRSRCFTHILNLAAKTILRQFDSPGNKSSISRSEAAAELAKLSVDLELEEQLSRAFDGTDNDKDDEEEDDVNGWIDEMAELDDDEREEMEEEAITVRLMLVKVRVSVLLNLYLLIK